MSSKHTTTLEDIKLRRKEKRAEVVAARTQMKQTVYTLFAPVQREPGVNGLMQRINTGIAIYDGVMTGLKIMRRIRTYFIRKK